MGKLLKARCKICRREGVSLCGRDRCAFKRRPSPPGVHGPLAGRTRLSSFGQQMREKQKAKRLYLVQEKQFCNLFKEVVGKRGDTGLLLVQLLERRLDNVVYRLGMAKTRRQARQIVSHGFIQVNGHKTNIPSFRLKINDILQVRPQKSGRTLTEQITEQMKKQDPPGWLTSNFDERSGKVTGLPEGDDLKTVFDVKKIVEFYSRI